MYTARSEPERFCSISIARRMLHFWIGKIQSIYSIWPRDPDQPETHLVYHSLAMPSYDVGGFLGWYIHLGIDWGARYLKLAWQIIPSGGDISDPALAPEPLYLPGYSESQDGIAQVMIDAGDGNGAHDGGNGVRGLYFGNAAVDKYLEQNPNCSHHTISSLKLMLHSDYQYREEVKAIRKAMECDVINFPGVEYLVGRHFAAIIQAAISRLRLIDKGQLGTESRPDLTTLPVEAQVAVPVMWDADARGVMQSGARRGGCSRTNIREESHANASTLVDDLQKAGIKCGDAFLLIDIGAATLDLSMMCFTKEGRLSLESLSSGRLPDPNQLASHLRRTGDSSGSSKLNADAYHHFTQEDAGGPLYGANLDEVCAAMNISENERHDQFSRQFVALKLESRDCNPVSFIHIEGRGGHDVRSVRISRDLMLKWLDDWIDRVVTFVNEWLTDEVPMLPRMAVDDDKTDIVRDASKKLQFAAITGGGSKSLLLCDRIHALLAAHKMNSIEWDPNKHSCCRGLLMNYNFETSRLPEHANFYLTGPMDNLPAGVDVDDIAASARVNGRTLTCLGVYDQHHEFNFSAREPVPRAFNMPISGDSSGLLHLEIWMNEALGALPDDTPLIQDGKLPRGFSKLAVTFVDVPDLHGRGFTRNKATGRPCFKVHGTIRLEKREESLYVVVTLFKARHSWCKLCKDAHRAIRNCQHDLNVSQPSEVLWTLEEEVWQPGRGALVGTALGGYEADILVPETDSGRRKRKRSATITQTPPIRRSARHLSASELFMPRDETEDAPRRSVTPLIVTSPPPRASISSNMNTPPRTNSDIRPTLRGNKTRNSTSCESDHTSRHQGRRGARVFARRTPSPAPISRGDRLPGLIPDSDDDMKSPKM